MHSWWVILFSLLCYTWLEHEQKQQKVTFQELSMQLMELKREKIEASHLNEKLLKQINSQSDPAWVELTLIKVLGLIPENHRKVYFPQQQGGSDHSAELKFGETAQTMMPESFEYPAGRTASEPNTSPATKSSRKY